MELLALIVIIIIVIGIYKSKKTGISSSNSLSGVEVGPTSPYHYGRRKYLMTQAENNFFKLLVASAGDRVNIFPQVRLSSLLYRAKGIEHRYWYAALSRINQKSIDYIMCDKLTGEILLAIELDDITHDTVIRQKRDSDVNAMLKEAGMPFIRFRNITSLNRDIVRSQIYEVIPQAFEQPKKYILERQEV